MAQWTITIQELLDDKRELFDFAYPNPHGNKQPENVRKSNLENMFLNEYFYREICYETFSKWKQQFKTAWIVALTRFNVFWKAYDREFEYMTHNETINKTVNRFYDLPGGVSQPDMVTMLTSQNNNDSTTTQRLNKSELDMVNEYINAYKSLDEQFINGFKNLFMKIY